MESLSHPTYLTVRARADRHLVFASLASAIVFDIAARSGLATIAASAWLMVAAAAIYWSGRISGLTSRALICAAPVLGVLLTVRSSPWVITPTAVAVTVMLLLGVSLGADGSGPSSTFPALGTRVATVIGHLYLAPAMFRPDENAPAGGAARKRALAIARGTLLGVPVMIIVGLLLGAADPIFRSWFDLTAILQHLVLAAIGAWILIGLVRAASARRPSPPLPGTPSLGTAEAAFVLGGLCALYATFAGAQFAALSAGGRYVLRTDGLTYAQYARSGFFQLLACAGITLLVLLGVRAFASPTQPALIALSLLTVALTIGVVIIAIRRLQLYEAAFGLTMLRLACLTAAVWIGIVFVLLAATLPGRGLPRRLFPAAVIISGLLAVGIWGLSNPAAVVARTNLRRAEHGRTLDVRQVARLGPDAVPVLLRDLSGLRAVQAAALRQAVCARTAMPDAGAAFNVSVSRADQVLARVCGTPG